ncbi:unnamed protein product [Penicillium egyptiacum]|uniref:Uncharacterized protein n=1 Tax=Penicillium egyptiacum TaxID=1303716 RepID=A0A9W4KF42_9EURO|nr:unnamed protein product [Penicillium egyptiacum]
MEPTMNPNDSPLSNLDLWCDWSGIPEEPVSITIAMELQTCGHPNLNLPILNVQAPNTVKIPSWVIRLKPDFHYDTDTPEKEAWQSGQEYGDETETYPANSDSVAESASVVVHDGSRDEDPLVVPRTVDTSGTYAQVDSSDSSTSSGLRKSQVNSLGSPHSSNPRKRSAKAASLPDSIPPDDEYQGTRHKLTMTKIDPPAGLETVSQDTSTTVEEIVSLVHSRPASLDETSVMPENILLPQDPPTPGLVPVSPSATSERLSLNSKTAAVNDAPEPGEIPLWHNAETPSKIDLSGTEPLTEANLLQRNYDTLSTRGCNGSFSDTGDSDKEKEDLLLSLESIGSPSFFSCPGYNPLPRTSAEIAENYKPKLILNNGILYVQTLPVGYSATYQIAISLKVRLQKGKSKDWLELAVSGLPRLAQFESGYLYFRTPPGQGMEFVTSSFKRHTLVESCLMAQFDGGKTLVCAFRKCNAEYYGQLKDYKVNTVIRTEVAEASGSSYLIKYNAVCSVDLINHNFWAEKCKFYIFVHGGPDGEFDAVFTAKKPLINSVRLQSDSIGISRLNIVSIPQALDMFMVSWEVNLPQGKTTWQPWIKPTLSYNEAESILQEDYAIYGSQNETIPLKHLNADTRCQFSCGQPGAICVPELNYFKPQVPKTPCLHDGFAIHKPKLIGPLSGKSPASKSTSTQTLVAETPAPFAEPKKPRRVRGLCTLLTLIKFLFHVLSFLASVYIIYRSYLLRNSVVYEVCVYGPVEYAKNLTTNPDVEKEANTVLAEFNPQPELFQSEVQQYVNITPVDTTPMPLRDRIDYLLGWRGPIAQE